MANLNPLISFEEPVTRQDLFDMWSTASFSGVGVDDFADGFIPVVIASSFSSAPSTPQPGQMFWHQSENVMYVFHDEVDNTAVSLWLAIGPDKFETAVLTVEPCGAGVGLEICGPDRRVQVNRSASESNRLQVPTCVGFNQSHINAPITNNLDGETSHDAAEMGYAFYCTSGECSGQTYWGGETAQSGEWIRMGIDGLVYAASATGSHPSANLATWTSTGGVCMDTIFDGCVQDINGMEFPWNNMIGATTMWNVRSGSAQRTEPWWLTKIAFCPRMARNGYFET